MLALSGAAHSVGPYALHGDHAKHPDGSVSAVIATDDLNIEALPAHRRQAVLSVFAGLLHTLEHPLQLIVRVRPLAPNRLEVPAAHDGAAGLTTAMNRHWRARVEARRPCTRDVLLAVRAARSSALDVAADRVLLATHAMGVGGRRLSDVALRDAFELSASGAPSSTPWSVHAQHAIVGGVWLRGYVMRRLPGHPVVAGWLAPLLHVPVACDIAIHLGAVSLRDALHTLGRRLRDVSAHRLLEAERGLIGDAHVDVALDSAAALRSRLARNTGRALQLSIVAVVRATRADELQRAGDVMRLAFHAAMLDVEPAHFRHLSAYVSSLPLACNALGSWKLVDSTAAATCVPWLRSVALEDGGYRIGACLRSGTPVRVNPFATVRHPNANVAVFAASGHGKSFAVAALSLEAATHGVRVVIVDPEGEYESVVRSLDGAYMRLRPGSETAFNVFDTGEGDDASVAAAVDLVTVMCGGNLSDAQRAHVDEAARGALAVAGQEDQAPLLSHCLPALASSAPEIAAVVRRFCTGGLGSLFDRPTSARFDAPVVGISLADMPEEHVAPLTLLVARRLWTLIRDRRRRHIVFDEVGALCEHAALRQLLVQLARRCRKYGASLVVATQNAGDLLGTAEGRVVATNAAVVLLGGHRPAETALMEEAYGLTQLQRHFLETAGRGQFLLLAGDRRLEIEVEVPGSHHRIITSAALATP